MIFAFATDDKSLTAFASESEAIAYCEGADVHSGLWQFFGPAGEPLLPRFLEQVARWGPFIGQGRYQLHQGHGASLLELLPSVSSVEGPEGLQSFVDVARYLRGGSRGSALR